MEVDLLSSAISLTFPSALPVDYEDTLLQYCLESLVGLSVALQITSTCWAQMSGTRLASKLWESQLRRHRKCLWLMLILYLYLYINQQKAQNWPSNISGTEMFPCSGPQFSSAAGGDWFSWGPVGCMKRCVLLYYSYTRKQWHKCICAVLWQFEIEETLMYSNRERYLRGLEWSMMHSILCTFEHKRNSSCIYDFNLETFFSLQTWEGVGGAGRCKSHNAQLGMPKCYNSSSNNLIDKYIFWPCITGLLVTLMYVSPGITPFTWTI